MELKTEGGDTWCVACGEVVLESVTAACKSAGFLGTPCGLNADWNSQAWHLGPSAKANVTDGDLYLLDNEDEDGTYFVAAHFSSKEEGANMVVMLNERALSLEAALKLARREMKGGR